MLQGKSLNLEPRLPHPGDGKAIRRTSRHQDSMRRALASFPALDTHIISLLLPMSGTWQSRHEGPAHGGMRKWGLWQVEGLAIGGVSSDWAGTGCHACTGSAGLYPLGKAFMWPR